MKRLLSLLLVMVLSMSLLSGCVFAKKEDNNSSSDNNATTTTDTTDEATPAATDVTAGADDSAAADATGLPAMNTTDPITLTYMNYDSDIMTQELAKKFMEKYPNITVNVAYIGPADYGNTLLNLVASGDVPDCFMYQDSDYALSNQLLYDMTDLWEADPENQNLLPTINEYKIGYYDSGRKWGTPIKFFPGAVFIDRSVMEKLNLDMPDVHWTWDEMIQLIKDATDPSQTPAYYGLGGGTRLDSLYGIAASQSIRGEFGWDGNGFDLGVWAVGEQQYSDLKLSGYYAPRTETQEMENWMGDWEAWEGASAHVAIMAEPFWSYMSIWDKPEYKTDLGINFVPYPVPSVEKVDGVANTIATMDMGGISAGTEHPREAYELLKFMSWGVDGTKAKLEILHDQSITNANGDPLVRDAISLPMTMDADIWADYRTLYPTDDLDGPYWDAFFANCTRPVPYGWESIAGYWTFCDEYFNNIGIHGLVDSGKAKAADYAEEATEMANQYHKEAMKSYFGIDWEPTK